MKPDSHSIQGIALYVFIQPSFVLNYYMGLMSNDEVFYLLGYNAV
jgi:hypothetical protein